jgi:hypothetical protein
MFRFPFVSLALLLALGTLAGCGGRGKAPDSSVSGKVTLGGRAVAGQVVFVGSDQKEIAAPINPEGAYQINNPPKGEYQVVVKGVPGVPVVPGTKAPGDAPPPGAAPPAKYAQPGNGLKFSITGGEQKYDIELK